MARLSSFSTHPSNRCTGCAPRVGLAWLLEAAYVGLMVVSHEGERCQR